MKGPKEERERKAPDWLDQLVEEIYAHKQDGQKPSLAFLMESLLNEIMRRERERFLSLYPTEQANGFYPRSLHLVKRRQPLRP